MIYVVEIDEARYTCDLTVESTWDFDEWHHTLPDEGNEDLPGWLLRALRKHWLETDKTQRMLDTEAADRVAVDGMEGL